MQESHKNLFFTKFLVNFPSQETHVHSMAYFPMAKHTSFQCSAADLLCTEETNFFCFNDDQINQAEGEKETSFGNGGSDLAPFVQFPSLSEECFTWMLEREKEHLPRYDYVSRLKNRELDVKFREAALDWMLKACGHFGFGELSLHTAISYFDRFISCYGLPVSSSLEKTSEKWAVQLVAVACLSLAAKIEEVYVPPTPDLQIGDPSHLFTGTIVQKMEMVILNHLDWKIKAYTPCNFIDYFLRKMNDVEFPPPDLITRSIKVITSTIKGIDFLEFRPSEIAAAIAIYVSGEMQLQEMDIDKALSGFIGVEKERVVKCLELIQALKPSDGNGSSSVPNSPSGVLNVSTFSFKSDEKTDLSCSNSAYTSPETKRRRIELDQTSVGGEGGGDDPSSSDGMMGNEIKN